MENKFDLEERTIILIIKFQLSIINQLSIIKLSI